MEIILEKEKQENGKKQLLFDFPVAVHKSLAEAPIVTLTNVSWSYQRNTILKNVNLSIYPNTRAGIVGLNGSGKSLLLQMIAGEKQCNQGGRIWRQDGLKIGYFHQHSFHEKFEKYMDETPIQYFFKTFGAKHNVKVHDVRCFLARFGIKDKMPLRKIGTFSGGEKTRLAFAELAFQEPHLILFDEPTNHLDMQGIDSLISGLQQFEGAFVIVSHNQYIFSEKHELIKELWSVQDQTVHPLKCSFAEYKRDIQESIL